MTIVFAVEVQGKMGVTGRRVDLESRILSQEDPGLWSLVFGGKLRGLGSQAAESEVKEQEAGPES